MNTDNQSIPAKILLYSTAAVVLTIGMREIGSILTTLFLSLFVALLFTPPTRWLKRKGVPGGLSVFIVLFLALLIFAVLGIVVLGGAIQFGNQLPLYQDTLIALIDNLTGYIPQYQGLSLQSILRSMVAVVTAFMISVINGVLNTGTTAGVILLTAAFLLIEAVNIPEKVQKETQKQTELQIRLSRFGRNVLNFIIIRTETSLVIAFVVTVFLLIGKINFAILWGVLIFLLSYIPYIGLILASIPPTMLGLFQYGPVGALAVIVMILVVDVLAENLVFPSLAGRGLNLSPAVLFLTLLYWSFVLGPVGVLLSVPLTIFVKIILESFEQTKWLARLMGPTEEIEEDSPAELT